MIPKAPPALRQPTCGAPVPALSAYKYAIPRNRKVKSRVKNSIKKATVDLSVQITRRVLKINHAYAIGLVKYKADCAMWSSP